tara:strand:+ start:1753 stop:1878 length:126 start_codon:yes stop_codon:yes gene_type:complete
MTKTKNLNHRENGFVAENDLDMDGKKRILSCLILDPDNNNV